MSFSTEEMQGNRLVRSRNGAIKMTEDMAHPARSVILVFEGFHEDDSDTFIKLLNQITKLVNRISEGIWVHENLKRNHADVDPDFHLEPITDNPKERERILDLILKFETISASHKPKEDADGKWILTHWEYRYPRGPDDKGNMKIEEADAEALSKFVKDGKVKISWERGGESH